MFVCSFFLFDFDDFSDPIADSLLLYCCILSLGKMGGELYRIYLGLESGTDRPKGFQKRKWLMCAFL